MPRLSLLLFILAVLGTAVCAQLYFRLSNAKQTLEQRLGDAHVRIEKLDSDLASAQEQTGGLKVQLRAAETAGEKTSASLRQTSALLQQAESRVAQAGRDLAQTRTVLEFYELTAREISGELGALRQDLEDTRATHASPEAVLAYRTTITELERQLAAAGTGAVAPRGPAASTAVFTNRAGRATVLTVGAGNAFVVLNFGSVRGARLGQKLAVNQGPAEVATVLINDVRPNFSIAHVLPESLRGVLQKGDSALLLH